MEGLKNNDQYSNHFFLGAMPDGGTVSESYINSKYLIKQCLIKKQKPFKISFLRRSRL